MRCELVAIGTELLLGQIVDTNSAWIAEQLTLAGIDSYFHTTVGDNLDRVVATLRQAADRSDAVICCGGLGPTQDDLTRDAIAAAMGVGLERDAAMVERIRALFVARGREMPDNNLRQAERPQGAQFIAEMPGTAPGLVCPWGDKVLFAVPGVPHEMREMVAGTIVPELRARAGQRAVIRSRVLRTWGHSESGIAERLHDRLEALDVAGNPTLAFQASGMEGLKVRITAKAPDAARAEELLAVEESEVRSRLGRWIFGADEQTMESVVLEALRARGLTLAVAESVTGGWVAQRLTEVPGASDVLRGGVVAYSSAVKQRLLGVPAGPVITEATAAAMADGVRKALGADVGIATTGVAGPEEAEGRPVGTVCLGIAIGENVTAREVRLPGDRKRVRQFATITLLDALRRALAAGPDVGSDG